MTEFDAVMEVSGDPVRVLGHPPFDPRERRLARMDHLEPGALVLMPACGAGPHTVEFAGALIVDAPELDVSLEESGVDLATLTDEEEGTAEYEAAIAEVTRDLPRMLGLLTREGWEHLTDNAYCCECVRVTDR